MDFMPKPPNNLEEFSSLIKVVEHLRGPQGCPWDKEQTHESLTRFAIEEAHELAEAINSGNKLHFIEELGDVLLQVILHSEIATQAGEFTIHDVIETLNEKMIRRHPHVFADTQVSSSAEVLKNWSEIKAEEKAKDKSKPQNPLSFDIPLDLPALMRSHKIGDKTRKIHFDWGRAEEVFLKVEEEVAELKEALQSFVSDLDATKISHLESEIGDVLFSVAQLARHLDLDSEQALRKTNRRFERRFAKMQDLVTTAGLHWSALSPAERESFWQAAKLDEKSI